MITHLQLEWVGDGALAIYDTADGFFEAPYYTLEFQSPQVLWDIRLVPASHRILISEGVYTTLDDFRARIAGALDMVKDLGDGCLFFYVRGVTGMPLPEDDVVVLGGMVFLPFPPDVELYHDIGTPLQPGDDVVDILLQMVTRSDSLHPVLAEAMRQQEEWRTRHRELERQTRLEKEAAAVRSLRLLREMLDPEQLQDLDQKKGFSVRGQDGHVYWIAESTQHNVYRIENDQMTMRYCIVMQRSGIPLYDLMLAQKLVIENDTPRFMALSNKWELDSQTQEWVQAIVPLDPFANPDWFPTREENDQFQEILERVLARPLLPEEEPELQEAV